MLVGLVVPFIFPSSSSMIRLPLPSTGSFGFVPPLRWYYEKLRLPGALPGPLRSSLADAVPLRARLFAPLDGEHAVGGLELFTGSPPGLKSGGVGPPRFLGNPRLRALH